MKLNLLRNLNIFLVLVLITPILIIILFLLRFTPQAQFQILLVSALIYLSLAILHHYKDRTLTLEIIIEYILIAILALLILQGLII
ncbi:MAG: hypothetical protein V1808_02835 [Candidatus Daviesbacteria bacterium]